jgi:sulfur carrier protein ThiS
MRVNIILHSYLREKLPAEKKGRANIEIRDGSTVADLFAQLDLPLPVAWALNGVLEKNLATILADQDEVRVFRQGAGGAPIPDRAI